MKVAELVKFSGEMLKRLHCFGIRIDDYRWLDLYEEYVCMRNEGEKTTYAVAMLSEKYDVCERKVYKVIQKMERECQIGAAV